MSRLGKQPLKIPEKTDVSMTAGVLTVKGPKGELTRVIRPEVSISIDGSEVTVAPVRKDRFTQALWGTYSAHVINMMNGVNEPFVKKLIVEGVGFRVELQGKELVLNVGFSHPIKLTVPEDLSVTVEKNTITIEGVNKDTVGQFAAEIRSNKKPEPYKGKGIRYIDEVIRRKQGKKAV